jgi:hypothetical protein
VRAALADERAFLREWVRTRGVQTNEVQRSWVLLPAFLLAAGRAGARTVDLVELGPSAGLNLVWDRYAYRYGAGRWGAPDAALELAGEERRPVPANVLAARPRVGRRVGIDRAPIDVTTDEGARLLTSFVWADQRPRLERLAAAIEALRRDPPQLVAGDVVELLPEALAEPSTADLTIVFQTAVLGFVPEEGRARVRRALEEAGGRRPLAFVSAGEPARDEPSWGLRLTCWPGGRKELVAHADYHGAWLDWEP